MAKGKILIGSDLSENSNIAIKVGLKWAQALGSIPILFHLHRVAESQTLNYLFPGEAPKTEQFAQVLDEVLSEKLKNQAERFSNEDQKIVQEVFYAKEIEKFFQYIKSQNVKLLILPLSNMISDYFLGGKEIEKLIRVAPIPVLLVKDDRALSPKTISFPFAFQGLSEDASYFAEGVCHAHHAKLIPIHIFEKDGGMKESYRLEDIDSLIDDDDSEERVTAMKERLIQLDSDHCIQELVIKASGKDSSKEALLKQLSALDSDLIIMGTSGKKGLERLFLGSSSEFILRNTPSSILFTKKF